MLSIAWSGRPCRQSRAQTLAAGVLFKGGYVFLLLLCCCRCTSDLLALTDLVRRQLNEQDRLTLGALITIDVHARDVVAELAAASAWL